MQRSLEDELCPDEIEGLTLQDVSRELFPILGTIGLKAQPSDET
jgi:hypothetical protein